MDKREKKFILWGFICCVFIIIFLVVQCDRYLYLEAISTHTIPGCELVQSFLRNFEWPLWTPIFDGGYPIIANTQLFTVFYPINVFFYLIFKSYQAYTILVALHLLMAFVFQYIYARYLCLSKTASCCASFFFVFSSMMFSGNTNYLLSETMVWIPLVLYFLSRGLLENRIRFIILSSFCYGIQMCSGSPQLWFYTGIAIVVHMIFTFQHSDNRNRYRLCIQYFMFAVLTIGIAAAQLLPMIELGKWAGRAEGAMSIQQATNYPFHPIKDFFLLFFPNMFGSFILSNSADSWGFIGWMGIFFGLIGMLFRYRDKNVKMFVIIACVGFLLSLGSKNPLFYVLVKLPGFSGFRYPIRYLFLVVYSITLLAGYGIDFIKKSNKEEFNRIKNIFLYYLIFLCILIGLSFIIKAGYGVWPSFFLKKLRFAQFQSISNGIYGILFLFLIIASLVFLRIKNNVTKKIFLYGCIVFAVIQLTVYDTKYFHFIPSSFYDKEPDTVIFLKKYDPYFGEFRIFSEQVLPGNKLFNSLNPDPVMFEMFKRLLFPHQNFSYNLQNIRRGTSVPLLRNNLLFYNYLLPSWKSQEKEASYRLLSLESVKYVITYREIVGKQFKKIYSYEDINIFKNRYALPMAYLVKKIHFQTDSALIPEMLLSMNIQSEAVVESDGLSMSDESYIDGKSYVQFKDPAAEFQIKKLHILKRSPRTLTLKTDLPVKRLLVFSQNYYPGWKVFIDGTQRHLYRVNYLYQGVIVPKGKHTVTFIYKSLSFTTGLIISMVSLIVAVLVYIFTYRRVFKRQHEKTG